MPRKANMWRRGVNGFNDTTFRRKTERAKGPLTCRHQSYFLQLFCDHVRTRRAADLKPGDVTSRCLKCKGRWGHNTQVTARGRRSRAAGLTAARS